MGGKKYQLKKKDGGGEKQKRLKKIRCLFIGLFYFLKIQVYKYKWAAPF